MNIHAAHNTVSVIDTGAHQEHLSESTVMGNVTLHFQVSHMQSTAVYVAISFQSCATDSQWAESVARAFANEQLCKANWTMIQMVAIHQRMNSTLTHNSCSMCSRTGHGVDCLHQRSNEGQCMHTMTNMLEWREWGCQSRLVHAINAEDVQVGQCQGISQHTKG